MAMFSGYNIGPDGKIYTANSGDNSLGVVNNPNILGIACNFVADQIDLQRECSLTLPSFIAGFDYDNDLVDCLSSVAQIDNENTIEIYPNPNNGQFTIILNSKVDCEIDGYNSLGRLIFSRWFDSTERALIQLQTVGIYHLVVRTEDEVYTEKVVVE